LTDPGGQQERFLYVFPDAKRPPQPMTAILKPGLTMEMNYDLNDFYRWGPCGPDRWGSFVKYLQPGKSPITMQMIWMPELSRTATNSMVSNCETFSASHPEWLFHK
jgi:hypothetical protein